MNLQGSSKKLVVYFTTSVVTIAILALIMAGVWRVMLSSRENSVKSFAEQNLNISKDMLSGAVSSIGKDVLFLSRLTSLNTYLGSRDSDDLQKVALDFRRYVERRTTLIYMIRFIDISGQEMIRVLEQPDGFEILGANELGMKKGTHYFDDSISLNHRMIYVSSMEISSADTVNAPLLPVVRVGTPVFDSQGRKRGVVIINYQGNALLGSVGLEDPNARGWYLSFHGEGNDRRDNEFKEDWWFTYPDQILTEAPYCEKVLEQLNQETSGVFLHKGSVYAVNTLQPILEAQVVSTYRDLEPSDQLREIGAEEYRWKLISKTPREIVLAPVIAQYKIYLVAAVVLLLPFLLILWLIVDRREQMQSEQVLENERQQLESIQLLARSIAHEFRQPLAGLQVISDLVTQKDFPEESLMKAVLKIQPLVLRIDDLVDRLLNLTEMNKVPYIGDMDIIDLHDSLVEKRGKFSKET